MDRTTKTLLVDVAIGFAAGLVATKVYGFVQEALSRPMPQLLGVEGGGFVPMQARLSSRRVQIAAWCIGRAQRASTCFANMRRLATDCGR